MWSRIKGYLLIAAAGAAVYFLLSNHIIFYGQEASVIQNVYLLKKTKLNLHHTFFSLHQKKPDAVMKIKPLREAGIGGLLVDLRLLTEQEKSRLETLYR
ncbi:MAG TPA: hypothetical protein VLT56_02495 [Desulfobacterales bacterium]|jgi:hypothetical protein|nr:hypothetical protein [Desulfobacterales bacterium]HSM88867.1 hypothetical protein [Desulfobacterales bacterium]